MNTVLNPHLKVDNLVVSTDNFHLEIRLLNGLNALTSTLVTLDISRTHGHLWSGYLFVEPMGIPGAESMGDLEMYRVPKGVIPHDEEHNGLLYRTTPPLGDTWDLLPEDADTEKYDYVDYEGAEDSLAGFFDYDDSDFIHLTDAIAAQVKVLNDWAEAELANRPQD